MSLLLPLVLLAVSVVVSAQEFQPLKPNQVPCIRFDDCGVCGGDNACLDCAGVPHGTATRTADGECVDSSTVADASASAAVTASGSFLVATALSKLLL
jgi:hypothetical protein